MLIMITKRILHLALVIIGMSLLMFIASRMLPGDPAVMAAGGVDASPEMIEHARKEYGLDKPLFIQYILYIKQIIIERDLGRSFIDREPIIDKLKLYYPATFELAGFGILFACLVGIPLGVISAVKSGSIIDNLSRVTSLFLVSMPIFWLGLMFIFIFYGVLNIFPYGARLSSNVGLPPHVTGILTIDCLFAGDFMKLKIVLLHLTLPSIVLGSISLGIIARMTRASVLEVLTENYIITGRAKGLSEKTVIWKYAFRNATIPIITVIGIQLGVLMGGAVLTETVFNWPGVGKFAIEAVDNKDYPSIMGFALTYSFIYALVNMIIDIIYAWLNPKISIK